MWIKMRSTWMNVDEPVKIILNKHRGSGITVVGAISERLEKPLFMLAKSTNSEDFMAFLKLLRSRFAYCKGTTIHLVLDNAAAHHNNFVKQLAAKLKIELMFLPAYTPELNPIEALWGIIKRDFKQRLMLTKHIVKEQPQFQELLQCSLDDVTPEAQQKAARSNHRAFLYQVLGDTFDEHLEEQRQSIEEFEQEWQQLQAQKQ
jgi:transposase